MYLRNLAAEIARDRITHEQLAAAIGKSKETFGKKINGEIEFKLTEMSAIRNEFFPKCTLDYLFAIDNKENMEHGETA